LLSRLFRNFDNESNTKIIIAGSHHINIYKKFLQEYLNVSFFVYDQNYGYDQIYNFDNNSQYIRCLQIDLGKFIDI